jgi:hypothetical protein
MLFLRQAASCDLFQPLAIIGSCGFVEAIHVVEVIAEHPGFHQWRHFTIAFHL